MKKKISVIITNRANFARMKSLLIEIKKSKKLSLQLILSGSALSHRFGQLEKELKKNKLYPIARSYYLIDGSDPIAQAKSTSLAISEFATIFHKIRPDLVITVGDRYETIATAIASSYSNILLAHTMGGELSGSIDESIRHAITKLSHYHFTACDSALKRVIRMGEDPSHVYNVGCPRLDLVKKIIEEF